MPPLPDPRSPLLAAATAPQSEEEIRIAVRISGELCPIRTYHREFQDVVNT